MKLKCRIIILFSRFCVITFNDNILEKGRIDMLKKLSKYLIVFVVCLSLSIQVLGATTSEKTVDEKEYDIEKIYTISLQDTLDRNIERMDILNVTDDGIFMEILDVESEREETVLISHDGQIYYNPIVFYDGIALIEYNGKYGYINKNYEWVFRPIFDEASEFVNKRALVLIDKRYMILNERGDIEYVLPNEADNPIFGEGYVLYSFDGVYWLWNNGNNVKLNIPNRDYNADNIDINPYTAKLTKSYFVLPEIAYNIDGKKRDYICHIFDKDGNWLYNVSACEEMNTSYFKGGLSGQNVGYIILQNGNFAICFVLHIDEQRETSKTQIYDNNGTMIAVDYSEMDIGSAKSYKDLFWCWDGTCYNSNLEKVNFLNITRKDNERKSENSGKMYNEIGIGDHYIVFWRGEWNKKIFEYEGEEYNGNSFVPETEITVMRDSVANPKDEPSLADKGKVDKMLSQLTEETAVYINGEPLTFDVSPLMKNDRVLVPMRAIFEALGAEVDWNDELQCATAKKDGNVIDVTVGSDNMLKNNEIVSLDAEACMLNDRTLVPLRAVSEALEARVEWLGDSNSVVITTE